MASYSQLPVQAKALAMWFVRFVWGSDGRPSWFYQEGLRIRAYRSEDGGECCAYVHSVAAPESVHGLISLTRLEKLRDLPGVECERAAPWHYVVATDVPSAIEQDFNAWYDQEHLPGFAAVPGTVRATRYRKIDGSGPRYHSCYDLVDRETLSGPAWQEVRSTRWTSRIRPHFMNARRTLYRRIY